MAIEDSITSALRELKEKVKPLIRADGSRGHLDKQFSLSIAWVLWKSDWYDS